MSEAMQIAVYLSIGIAVGAATIPLAVRASESNRVDAWDAVGIGLLAIGLWPLYPPILLFIWIARRSMKWAAARELAEQEAKERAANRPCAESRTYREAKP